MAQALNDVPKGTFRGVSRLFLTLWPNRPNDEIGEVDFVLEWVESFAALLPEGVRIKHGVWGVENAPATVREYS